MASSTITRSVSSALISDMFWCRFELAKRLMFWSVEMKTTSASGVPAAFRASSMMRKESFSARIDHPISTSRKRAAGAPCATRIVCIGSPLPQFGRPQICHESRSPMASQERQKSGVVPV